MFTTLKKDYDDELGEICNASPLDVRWLLMYRYDMPDCQSYLIDLTKPLKEKQGKMSFYLFTPYFYSAISQNPASRPIIMAKILLSQTVNVKTAFAFHEIHYVAIRLIPSNKYFANATLFYT